MIDPEAILNNRNSLKHEVFSALAEALNKPKKPWCFAKERPTTVFSICLNSFISLYEKQTGMRYSFQQKDAGCLNSLIKKLYSIAKNTADEQIIHAFEFLMQKLPSWYLEHGFSLCVINSKFNEIIAEIKKNGTDKKGKISDSYKHKVFSTLYASRHEQDV